MGLRLRDGHRRLRNVNENWAGSIYYRILLNYDIKVNLKVVVLRDVVLDSFSLGLCRFMGFVNTVLEFRVP